MILEEILGNVNDVKLEGCHVETIYLNNEEMLKRIIKAKSDHGNDYGIIVPDGVKLKDGDILLNDGYNVVLVKFAKEDVLIIKPKDITEMGQIAHYIGNKHFPAQFINGQMIIQYDHVIEEDLNLRRIKYSRENLELKEAFRHVDFTHRH